MTGLICKILSTGIHDLKTRWCLLLSSDNIRNMTVKVGWLETSPFDLLHISELQHLNINSHNVLNSQMTAKAVVPFTNYIQLFQTYNNSPLSF